MGVSINQHLGPYLKIKAPTKPVEYKVHTCSNQQCSVNKRKLTNKDKFCSKCGSENKQQTFTSYERICPPFERLTKLSQVFTPNDQIFDGFIYLLPMSDTHKFHITPRDTMFLQVAVSSENINTEIQWFKDEFKDEINNIQEWSNGDKPMVEWGLISYQI